MKKLIEKAEMLKDKMNGKLIAMETLALSTVTIASADVTEGKSEANEILDIIFKYLGIVFIIVGALMLFSGIMSYVMAYRNDDPEKKHTASMSIGAGAAVLIVGIAASTIVKELIAAI